MNDFLKYMIVILMLYLSMFATAQIPIKQEFQLNSTTGSIQWNPRMARLADDRFFVCWESKNQDGDGFGIFGQLFSFAGEKIGREIQINSLIAGDQIRPKVAAAGNCFAVVWQTEHEIRKKMHIKMRIFDLDVKPLTDEFFVEKDVMQWNGLNDQFAIAGLKNSNSFAIAWHVVNTQEYIQVKLCSSKGVQQENIVVEVKRGSGGPRSDFGAPQVAAFPNDDFIVCFHQDIHIAGVKPNKSAIWLQRFDQSGRKIGGLVKTARDSTRTVCFPNIATAVDGQFVVCWLLAKNMSGIDGSVYCQTFGQNGKPTSEPYKISRDTFSAGYAPGIVTLNNNHYFITWAAKAEGSDDYDIFAQMLRLDGTQYSDQIRLNKYTAMAQHHPTACLLDDKKLAVVWDSNLQDGSEHAVIGQFIPRAPRALSLAPFSVIMPQMDNTSDSTGLRVEWSDASPVPHVFSCEMNYTLYYSKDHDFDSFGAIQTGDLKWANLDKLQKGELCYLKVCAQNLDKDKSWSNKIVFFVSHTAKGEESEAYQHFVQEDISCEWIPETQWEMPYEPPDSSIDNSDDSTETNFLVSHFSLSNKPNPFNNVTSIKYELPSDGVVGLDIYDTHGRHVITLVKGPATKGVNICYWWGEQKTGFDCASGVYFYRLEFKGVDSTEIIETKKMSFVK